MALLEKLMDLAAWFAAKFGRKAKPEVTPTAPRAPEGLQKGFRLGERLPWKRIEFVVTRVESDEITLRPVRTTAAFQKERARQQEKSNGRK